MLGLAAKSSVFLRWSEISCDAAKSSGWTEAHHSRFVRGMEHARDHLQEVVGRMFAVLTARLETAVMLAVDGQGADCEKRAEAANELIDIAEEAAAIAEAVHLLLADQNRTAHLG